MRYSVIMTGYVAISKKKKKCYNDNDARQYCVVLFGL